MWRKPILHIFHESSICNNICLKKYPWGWKKINNIPQLNFNYENIELIKFKDNTIEPYNIIYNSFLKNKDFLDYQFTTPKLSIALNNIRSTIKDKTISSLPNKINVNEIKILDNKIIPEIFTCNYKYLGYFTKQEIYDEITIGFIGPEIQHLWDKKPSKQIITLSYKSDTFHDIIEWERDLSVKEPFWQVSNINYILKN